jgi:hypothetical protein
MTTADWMIPEPWEHDSDSHHTDPCHMVHRNQGHALPVVERRALVKRARHLMQQHPPRGGRPDATRQRELAALAHDAGVSLRVLYRYLRDAPREYCPTCQRPMPRAA